LIYLRQISLSYLDRVIFDKISWTIHPKSRIGLVGPNGAGKTTLLRAILGQIPLDAGTIDIAAAAHHKIGYLPQDLVELPNVRVIDFLKAQSGIAQWEQILEQLERQLNRSEATQDQRLQLSQQYADAVFHFSALGGYAFEAKASQILKGFGFEDNDRNRLCSHFSGGWKMRIMLSAILLMQPDIMLLDEPTNHLDTESMEWLESFLKIYSGTLLTISHDHYFLDKIVSQIAELDHGRIELYRGNYSHYLREKEKKRVALEKEMELQKAQIKKIETFVERFRYKASKAAQVQSRIRMLDKFKEVKIASKSKTASMTFPEVSKSDREVVRVIDLQHAYGNIKVLENVHFTLHRQDKAALVGINGAGKSTLARLLSGMEKPAGGQIVHGSRVKIGFFSQESASNLDYQKTIWEELNQSESKATDQQKRNLLGAFLFSGDDVFKPISVLSGGEKSRLALLKILIADANFLILDEPTNHLDIITKNIFQEALREYPGTLVMVSHDRYFLDRVVNKVIELKNGFATVYDGNYSYYIEKRAETGDSPQEIPLNTKKSASASPSARDQKRQEAEKRKKLYPIKSRLKKELTEIEQMIQSLENEKSLYESRLCDPQFWKDPSSAKDAQIALNNINKKLEECYYKWSDLQRNYDKIILFEKTPLP